MFSMMWSISVEAEGARDLAYQAWDLQTFSGGRFLLGIGSQVKAHIEKRFGTDFDPPAARMRDYILAL